MIRPLEKRFLTLNFIFCCRPTEINVTGLGALNNLATDISHWCLGTFNTGIVPKLEVELYRALKLVTSDTTIAEFYFSKNADNKSETTNPENQSKPTKS